MFLLSLKWLFYSSCLLDPSASIWAKKPQKSEDIRSMTYKALVQSLTYPTAERSAARISVNQALEFGKVFLLNLVYIFRKVSNMRFTLVGNKIVDHSDVLGASLVGAAPTTSSFSTQHVASMDWAKTTARRDKCLILENWRFIIHNEAWLKMRISFGNRASKEFFICHCALLYPG